MGKPAKIAINSRWKSSSDVNSEKVWIVITRKPFGKLEIRQEGRAVFGESRQKDFLASHTRILD